MIVLTPEDDPELAEANWAGGMRKCRAGQDLIVIHVLATPDHEQLATLRCIG